MNPRLVGHVNSRRLPITTPAPGELPGLQEGERSTESRNRNEDVSTPSIISDVANAQCHNCVKGMIGKGSNRNALEKFSCMFLNPTPECDLFFA